MKKSKRKVLGQHFLSSQNIAKRIVQCAEISSSDTVLEVGTGHGVLLPFLCKQAKRVISYETDSELVRAAKLKFSNLTNLELVNGDGFESNREFSVFVSNLPYSRSRDAIEWLAQQSFSKAIVMVQREFAKKLAVDLFEDMHKNIHGSRRRAVSVISGYAFRITKIMDVNKKNFSPPPKIDSVVLRLVKKNLLAIDIIRIINNIFSYRRKKIANILGQFGIESKSQQRLDDLSDEEIVCLAKKIREGKKGNAKRQA